MDITQHMSTKNSNLLHQLFLTDNEALSVVGNSYSVIPQNLMYKKEQELLSNDPRSKNEQDWTLKLKKKKRGPAPRCRACGRIQKKMN